MKGAVITFAILAFASPTMAMDYVKCEAMNKAASRLEASKTAEVKKVWKTYTDAFTKACGRISGGIDALKSCGIEFEAANKPQNDTLRAEVESQYDERIEKVKADYSAAGCY